MIEKELYWLSTLELHARPSSRLANKLALLDSDVWIKHKGNEILVEKDNPESIVMDLMMWTVLPGDCLTVKVSGSNEIDDMQRVEQVLLDLCFDSKMFTLYPADKIEEKVRSVSYLPPDLQEAVLKRRLKLLKQYG